MCAGGSAGGVTRAGATAPQAVAIGPAAAAGPPPFFTLSRGADGKTQVEAESTADVQRLMATLLMRVVPALQANRATAPAATAASEAAVATASAPASDPAAAPAAAPAAPDSIEALLGLDNPDSPEQQERFMTPGWALDVARQLGITVTSDPSINDVAVATPGQITLGRAFDSHSAVAQNHFIVHEVGHLLEDHLSSADMHTQEGRVSLECRADNLANRALPAALAGEVLAVFASIPGDDVHEAPADRAARTTQAIAQRA